MLGPQQDFATTLRNSFFNCIKTGRTEALAHFEYKMKQEGIVLSFMDQVRVLDEAIVLPNIIGGYVVQLSVLCPEIQRAGRALVLNNERGIIPLFGQELQKAREEGRVADAHLIESHLAPFIDPKVLRPEEEPAQTFTPAAMAQRERNALQSQEDQRQMHLVIRLRNPKL